MVKLIVILLLTVFLGFTQENYAPLDRGFYHFDHVQKSYQGILQAPRISAQKYFTWRGETGHYLSSFCTQCSVRMIKLYTSGDDPPIWERLDHLSHDSLLMNTSNFFRSIPLHLEHNGKYRLEVEAQGQALGNLYLDHKNSFRRYEHQKLKYLLWYVAVLLVFIWVNGIIAMTTNTPSSRYYLGYLIFYTLSVFIYTQLFTYFLQDFGYWIHLLILSFFFLSLKFLAQFLDCYLKTRPAKFLIQKLIKTLHVLAILSLFPIDIWIPFIFEICALLGIFALFAVTITETIRSPQYDLNFIGIAMSLFLIGNSIGIISKQGILGHSLEHNRYLIIIVTSLLEIMICTLFIAMKVHMEKAQNLRIVKEQEQFRLELMRNIAHELRTPLVGLSGVAEEHQDQKRLGQIAELLHQVHQVDPRMRDRDEV